MKTNRLKILSGVVIFSLLMIFVGNPFLVISQNATLQVVLSGKVLPVNAERRGQRIFVPVVPVARELGYIVEIDVANEIIRVVRVGVEVEFNKRTSDIRENGVTVSGVPFASEVIFSPNNENILLPIEVIGGLLNVSVIVNDRKNVVEINSKTATSAIISQKTDKFEMSGFDYAYNSNYYNNSFYQTLNLTSTGRIGSSVYHSNLNFIGTSQGRFLDFYGGNFTLRRKSGEEFQFGDIINNVGTEMSLMNTLVRGALYSRPTFGNKAQISLFGGRLYSGFTENLFRRRFNQSLQFDTTTVGSRFSFSPYGLKSNSIGVRNLIFSFGTMWYNGEKNKGLLFDSSMIYSTRKLNLFTEIAANNATYETPNRQLISGFGSGVTVRGTYKPWDFLNLQAGYEKFSPKFTNASRLNTYSNRQSFNFGVGLLPFKNLSLNASATFSSYNRPTIFGSSINREFKTTNYNASLNYDPQKRFLPRFSVSANIIDNNTFGKYTFVNVNVSKDLSKVRLFGNYILTNSNNSKGHGLNFGANINAEKIGQFQVQQSLYYNKSQVFLEDLQCQINFQLCFNDNPVYRLRLASSGLNVDWTPKENLFKRLYFSVGAGYLKDSVKTGMQFRTTAGVNLPFKQTFQVSYYKNPYYNELRFSVSGSLAFWKKKESFSSQLSDESLVDVGKINGRVYADENGNRQYDAGIDSPMSNVRVRLNNGREVKSDVNGNYFFESVPSGEHHLALNLEDVRASLVPANGLDYKVFISPRSVVNTSFRLVKAGSVSGRIYRDFNENRQYDVGEGLTDIRLLSSSGRATYSDSDGTFLLSDLPPGEQSIFIDERYHPENLILETTSLKVLVESGKEFKNCSFVYKAKPREVKEVNFGNKNTKP